MTTANTPSSKLNPSQRALLAVKAMRKKLEDISYQKNEPIAVVGMSCRLPGGVSSPEDFWQLLYSGKDAITDIPGDRWDINKYFNEDPAEPGKMYVRQGGFIDDVYHFDRDLFGLSKRESQSMDPQQRLLLELSWEALERSGIAPRKAESRKRTGLFVGMATNDYSRFHIHSNDLNDIDVYSFTGCAPSIASGRISQLLDLGGPTLSIDTACSSSLVALHLARQSILADECELALVGGVNLMLSPENTIYFCKTSALSPAGRCKTFDEAADGYVRSEGGGILVLKRLSKALADNDNIVAVLQGTAINHDGEGIGLTAPNGDSQQRLVEQALQTAGLNPDDLSFVETHGTGTPLGDPIELQALGRVLGKREQPLAIGSCKSNIGHAEAAAGIAGMLKTVLCLQHKTLVPNLHFDKPSSFIPWEKLPLRVVQQVEPWQPINGKRFAGVSSFGFSGTNGHAIFTEAPQAAQHHDITQSNEQILALSGKSPERLRELVQSTLHYAESQSNLSLSDFCYSMNRGKGASNYRALLRFNTSDELRQQLGELLQKPSEAVIQEGTDLPALRLDIADADKLINTLHDNLLQQSIYYATCYASCQSVFGDSDKDDAQMPEFLEEYRALPEQFSRYFAFIKLLQDLCGGFQYINAQGIALLAAEAAAKMISFDDAIKTCSSFIAGKHHTLTKITKSGSNSTCLLNGSLLTQHYDFDTWYQILTAERQQAVPLDDDGSFTIDCSAIYSGAGIVDMSAIANQPAILISVCEALYLRGYNINWQPFYQGSSARIIATPVSAFIREELRLPAPKISQFESAVPQEIVRPKGIQTQFGIHPLLGSKLVMPNTHKHLFQQYLAPHQVPFLRDHGFLEQVVVPATAYLEIITAAVRKLTNTTSVTLEDISYHAGLYLPDNEGVYIQVEIEGDQITLYSAPEAAAQNQGDNAWTLHCTATKAAPAAPAMLETGILAQVAELQRLPHNEQLYVDLNRYGYLFGPAHQGMTRVIHQDSNTTVALVEAHPSIANEFGEYGFHPAHLDSCCHAILELLDRSSTDAIFITLGKDRVKLHRNAEKQVFVKATLQEKTEHSVKANLAIYSLNGECIAQVEGYTMKCVNRAQLLPSASDTNKRTASENGIMEQRGDDKWLYRNRWQVSNIAKTQQQLPAGRWLITGYSSTANANTAETLQHCLKQEGVTAQMVALEELPAILSHAQVARESVHILHLCSDNVRLFSDSADQVVGKTAYDGYMSLTEIVKAISVTGTNPTLYTLTTGAIAVDGSESHVNFPSATLWGAGRSLVLELPQCRFANIDLDPSLPLDDFSRLKSIFAGQFGDEDQFALRNNQLFINRLESFSKIEPAARDTLAIADKRNFKLAIDEQGAIDNLHYVTRPNEDLEAHDVEIKLAASALNFYDVVTALDLIDTSLVNGKENDECRFGLDAVGQITRVGSAVSRYQTGDWVMGFAPGCMASHVRVHEDCTAPKPTNLSLFESATIPTAFLTAHYALNTLAKMQPGDKVLIHAAAGGVGIAAINLANVIGAEVYATASEPKWPLLRQLGVKHIYNSRTLDFADQILRDTQNQGVDIVLNSFIGDYIHKNVDVLKAGGRFVEIGEREILTEQQVKAYNKAFEYYPFTLFEISRDQPAEIREMFEALQTVWESPAFTGIPYQPYSAENIKEAFRVMQQGKHKGKLVIELCPGSAASQTPVQHTRAALITGGLGGIGWAVAQWLASSDIETIYITGRRPLNETIEQQIATLSKHGKTIKYLSVDVGSNADVQRLFNEIYSDGVTLTAILHAAGMMNNALMADEDPIAAADVLTAKTLGTWYLHQASLHMPLQHFICFSSTTALLGAAGASSYAAGNAFVDSLMQYRCNLGLAAQAVNWGAWKEVGMLTRLNSAAQEYWQENGMQALPTATALAMLNRVSELAEARVAVLPADWSQWNRQYSKLPSLLLSTEETTAAQQATARGEATSLLAENSQNSARSLVTQSVRKVLRLDDNAVINEQSSFREMGIDSLMSVELRNILSRAIGEKLSSTLLFNYADVKSLTEHLQNQYSDKLAGNTEIATASPSTTPDLSPTVTQATQQHQQLEVLPLLKDQLRHLLRLAPDAPLNVQEPFKNLGIDSLMSVELRNTLSKKLGIKLSSTVLFNYTTIELLAAHLSEQLNDRRAANEALNQAVSSQVASFSMQSTMANAAPVMPKLETPISEEPSLAELRALLDAKLMEMDTE